MPPFLAATAEPEFPFSVLHFVRESTSIQTVHRGGALWTPGSLAVHACAAVGDSRGGAKIHEESRTARLDFSVGSSVPYWVLPSSLTADSPPIFTNEGVCDCRCEIKIKDGIP